MAEQGRVINDNYRNFLRRMREKCSPVSLSSSHSPSVLHRNPEAASVFDPMDVVSTQSQTRDAMDLEGNSLARHPICALQSR